MNHDHTNNSTIDPKISSHYEKILIEEEYRNEFYQLLEKVLTSNYLAQGPVVMEFEKLFSELSGMYATSTSSGSGALYAVLNYIDIKNYDVIIPTFSCVSIPLTVMNAGGNVIFADCNKNDMCICLDTIKSVLTPATKAVIVIHASGHIAFDIVQIANFCKKQNIALIEDCCHADGATYLGRYPGAFGLGGIFSFHASKLLPVGEGGMFVSKKKKVTEYVEKFKNYGHIYNHSKKKYIPTGFNLCLGEISAALGIIQLQRRNDILKWKQILAQRYDKIFSQRISLPKGMISSNYKYVVFDSGIINTAGKLFNTSKGGRLSHELLGHEGFFPVSSWIAKNHHNIPIFYGSELSRKNDLELKKYFLGGKE